MPSLDVCCLSVLHFTSLKYDNLGINNYWEVGHLLKLAFQCVSHPGWVNGLWFVEQSSVSLKSLRQFEPNVYGIVGGPLVNASNCCLLSKTTNGTLDWVAFSSPNITPLQQTDFHSRNNPKIVLLKLCLVIMTAFQDGLYLGTVYHKTLSLTCTSIAVNRLKDNWSPDGP